MDISDASAIPAALTGPVEEGSGADSAAAGRRETADEELDGLFRAHSQQLGRFLSQVVGDRGLADDLMQETFLTALRERGQLASVENPRAWLFRIAHNRALHALRTRRRARNAFLRLARERRSGDEGPADAIAVRDLLARTLKPRESALLVLRYVHGFGSGELAEIVERSPEAVRQELVRTRRKLLAAMAATPQAQQRER